MIRAKLKFILSIIAHIDNDKDFEFMGFKHPIKVFGLLSFLILGSAVSLSLLMTSDTSEPKEALYSEPSDSLSSNHVYSGIANQEIANSEVNVHLQKIEQDVEGMAAAIVGINGDLKAFFFGTKFGLESHFDFPINFGNDNVNQPKRQTEPKKQEERPHSQQSDEPGKKVPTILKKPDKPKKKKVSKNDDCPDVKIVIIKDTCNCGDIVIDTLSIKR